MKRFLTFVFLTGIALTGYTQLPIDSVDFLPPLKIPFNLSGNFGELRRTHFHTGLDIKTQKRIGIPVYACDSGYVSRIKISPYGYGNAVYISHPSGYTTVYAHLSELDDDIRDFLRKAQYDLKSFEVDLVPGVGQLKIKRGQQIGKSGNSGSSGGPHLHFEIRETETEHPVNPLFWNFPITDTKTPGIYGVAIRPMDKSSSVGNSRSPKSYTTSVPMGNCKLSTSTINCFGKVGIEVHTFDKLDNNANACGIYSMKIWVNDELNYHQELDKLDFEVNGFVNSHKVYSAYQEQKKTYHRGYRLPFNQLKIYKKIEDDGIIAIEDGKNYKIKIEVKDVKGNTSNLSFEIRGKKLVDLDDSSISTEGLKIFKYDTINAFRSDNCNVFMPRNVLYEDCVFDFSEKENGYLSPLVKVGSTSIPVHDYYIIKLKSIDTDVPKDKLVIMKYDPKKDRHYSRGGEFKNGWVSTRIKSFGSFYLTADTIAPKISEGNFKKDMKGRSKFYLKAVDDLSGIEKFEANIDGNWALLDYDYKTNMLTYHFDKNYIESGEHELVVKVTDERGNEGFFSSIFTWTP